MNKTVLVACEESQAVCKAFRKRGFEAYSCDLQDCSGGHPEWHIKGDVLRLIGINEPKGLDFCTVDGMWHHIYKWDLVVAHPPCTYLTVSGNRWFNIDKYGSKAIQRYADREDGIDFFLRFVNAWCEHIAIENPIGIMSSVYKKPTQIIQPWQYGDPFTKSTCLWLKNLPALQPKIMQKPEIEYFEWTDKNGKKKRQNKWYIDALTGHTREERQRIRSKTFPGIAKAMAKQWGDFLNAERV